MRTLIIGDVHGSSTALQTLLKALSPDPQKDRVILLGDLFDRGPDSWQVFQTVKELERTFEDHFVLLRGNHEDYLLQPQLSFSQRLVWERVGRPATVHSFKQHGEKMEDAAPWIREHSVLFFRGEEFQCVHAGLKINPIEANDTWTILHDHNIVLENRYAGPLTITGHIALNEPVWFAGDGERTGVLPLEEWLDLPEQGIICIDAGCGKGGRLIGMELKENQFILHSA